MNAKIETSDTFTAGSGARATIDIDQLVARLAQSVDPLQTQPHAAILHLAVAAHQTRLLSAVIDLRRFESERTDSVRSVAKAPLSALAFSLIADVSVVASQLMDKKDVTACTYRDKLTSDAVDMINKTSARLMDEKERLGAAIEWFASATDPGFFEEKVKRNELRSDAVYREIERRAACLLACQVAIAAALTSPNDTTDDWPPEEKPTAPTKKQAR